MKEIAVTSICFSCAWKVPPLAFISLVRLFWLCLFFFFARFFSSEQTNKQQNIPYVSPGTENHHPFHNSVKREIVIKIVLSLIKQSLTFCGWLCKSIEIWRSHNIFVKRPPFFSPQSLWIATIRNSARGTAGDLCTGWTRFASPVLNAGELCTYRDICTYLHLRPELALVLQFQHEAFSPAFRNV